MKIARLLVLLGLVAGLSSCMWGVPDKHPTGITKDTLSYTYQNIKKRAEDCGNRPDSGCTVATIKYPVFQKAKALNDTVTTALIKSFAEDKADTSLNLLADNFIKSFTNFKLEDPQRSAKMFFTLDIYAKVIRQDSSLTTLEIGGYKFTGGAHGATYVRFVNWDSKANKNLKLSDILITGYEAKLNQAAEALFRKEENLSATASLKDDYFFKDAKFALNNNFLITPTGLRFLYNIYEIKPYAAGRTELDIPWAQIKSLIKPNTIISQYIK